MKTCSKCEHEVSTERATYCRCCWNAYAREYRARLSPERRAELNRRVRTAEETSARNAARRDRSLRHKYNVTAAEVDEAAEAQDHLCSICMRRLPLVVDHDHLTGEVRGLLCSSCNKGLGFFKDNIGSLELAIAYLKDFK